MKHKVNKIWWLGIVAVFLMATSSIKADEYPAYILQKNGSGGYEIAIQVFDDNLGSYQTRTIQLTDSKLAEYIMAAISQALSALPQGTIGAARGIFHAVKDHPNGILFRQGLHYQNTWCFAIYKDEIFPNDVVLQLYDIPDWTGIPTPLQSIRLKTNGDATAEQITYFDYAVSTFILNKIFYGIGYPIITQNPDAYNFNLQFTDED
jgi:hypothetical protein